MIRYRRKGWRVAAGLAAFALIGLILFAANAFLGNPISSAIAKSAMKEHIHTRFPELKFRFDSKVGYNFKDGSYVAQVQSLTSGDTRFYVEYHGRSDVRDDYNFQVTEYSKTLQRLELSYGELLKDEWSRELGLHIRHVHAMYQTDGVNDYKAHLKLDMPFDPRIPIPLSINISMDASSMDVTQASDILRRAHEWAASQGYPVEQYAMDVEYGDQLFMLYGVKANQIEKGELTAILEKAQLSGEYDGVIVHVKGKDNER